MFFFSDKSFWQLESGEQGTFTHLVLGIEELLGSLECLQNLMASLGQLFIVDVLFVPTYFIYLFGHLVTVGRKHRARTGLWGDGGGREGESTGHTEKRWDYS